MASLSENAISSFRFYSVPIALFGADKRIFHIHNLMDVSHVGGVGLSFPCKLSNYGIESAMDWPIIPHPHRYLSFIDMRRPSGSYL